MQLLSFIYIISTVRQDKQLHDACGGELLLTRVREDDRMTANGRRTRRHLDSSIVDK